MNLRIAIPTLTVALVAAASATPARAQSAPSTDPYMQRAIRVLQSTPLIDGHNDLPWAIREDGKTPMDVEAYDLRRPTRGMTDLARLKAGMIGAQFWSVYTPGERDAGAYAPNGTVTDAPGYARVQLEQIDIARRMIAKYPDRLALALTADDIRRDFKEGKIGSLLGLEGGHAIDNSLGVLRAYYDLGVRYMTLTHNVTTDWADAALDSARHGGLTPFGKEVVREMNRLGMLVDLAHVSPGTMSDALDVSEAPVIFSHSGARALVDYPRNVPDSILRRVTRNGGIVMVPFVPSFVSAKVLAYETARGDARAAARQKYPGDTAAQTRMLASWRAEHPEPHATLTDVADVIDHVRKVAGVDHVGIGSDLDGITETVVGLEDVSKFPALFAELARRGWSDDDLRKLAGENLLRVFSQAETVAKRLQRERPASTATIASVADDPIGQQPLDGFDAYVDRAVHDWHVPGLAIAVVKGDSVVFAKGYGVRTLGKPDRVDSHTMFANASTTKAFTAMALAMLVDEGKVHWDDPVTKYLPTFEMYDPWVTREFTVRDLLSHRSGLGDDDLLWFGSPNTFADILHRMRFIKPVSSFRSRYNYQNIMYATAGHVVEAASGMPWSEFVRTRILQPLGMTETVTDLEGLKGRSDVATPHDIIDDTLRPIAYRNLDNIAPAGAMNSSVSDMTKWIRFLLDSGRVNGKRLVSDSAFTEMFTPQTIIRESDFYPTAPLTHAHFTDYGMGWFLEDYRGHKVAMHTGSIDGMSAIVGLVPDERVGVVVFENEDHAELRHALMWSVFDRYLHAPSTDWSARLHALFDSATARRKAAEQKVEQSRIAGTHPSLPLERYVGTYADSLYGTVSVRLDHDSLVASFGPDFVGPLEHWNYDTFRAHWKDRELGTTFFTFALGADGRVARVHLSGVDDFTRVREPASSVAGQSQQ